MTRRHTPLRFAADLGAAMIDTGITLWWRWPMLMAAGTSSKNAAELNRMVLEKAAAVTAGMAAAQTETMKIAAAALLGKPTPHASTTVAAASLRPALRTVKANARRLRRKKR